LPLKTLGLSSAAWNRIRLGPAQIDSGRKLKSEQEWIQPAVVLFSSSGFLQNVVLESPALG
jgi:hypothetical protein